jgi:GAF domain-containing protein
VIGLENPRLEHRSLARVGSWSPADYVTSRRFCPLDDIQVFVDGYRADMKSSEVVVLSVDAHACLRTASFVSHADTEDGQSLAALIQEHPFRVRDMMAQNPLWRKLNDRNLGIVLEQLADPKRYERPEGGEFFALLNQVHANVPWRIVGGTFTNDSSTAINCVVLYRGGRPARAREFLRTLTAAVNGTAAASTHRDRAVTVQVERALEIVSRQALGDSVDSYLPIVQMARRVTQSSAAALFLYIPTSASEERLVAHSVDAPSGYYLRSTKLPEVDLGESAPLAAAAFSRRRALLLMDRPTEPVLSPTWLHRDGQVRHEIAVPTPAAPGGASTPNAGVIVLCRGPGLDEMAYGNYELALVRNVALRVALLRTSIMMDEAGLAIANAAETFAVADAGPGSPRQATIGSLNAMAGQTRVGLPEDLRRALPHLRPIIEFAGLLTGSHSVTLRLLVRGGSGRNQYSEPLLIRAVAWPSWQVEDEPAVIRLSDRSVNAWVGRNGRKCYISDLQRRDAYTGYEDLQSVVRVQGRHTRAELCVPVFVDERFIGTVDFESSTPNAFAFMNDIGRGCAAMVALAVAAIRRKHLRDVISIGSDVQSSAHDLAGLADRLRKATDPTSRDSSIQDALETLNEVLPVLRPRASAEPHHNGDVWPIVVKAARDAGITAFRGRSIDAETSGLELGVRWSRRVARRFYLAMFEVFRNVNHHGSIDALGYPALYPRLQEIGGRKQAELEIVHGIPIGARVDARTLYRVPVEAYDRMHFGAYTAGAIIRSLGGDIVARIVDTNYLVTHVSVPAQA